MKTVKIFLAILVLIVTSGLSFYIGRETGRKDAFTRGTMFGYKTCHDLMNQVVNVDEFSEEYFRKYLNAGLPGIEKNFAHMGIQRYEKYYDMNMYAPPHSWDN